MQNLEAVKEINRCNARIALLKEKLEKTLKHNDSLLEVLNEKEREIIRLRRMVKPVQLT